MHGVIISQVYLLAGGSDELYFWRTVYVEMAEHARNLSD